MNISHLISNHRNKERARIKINQIKLHSIKIWSQIQLTYRLDLIPLIILKAAKEMHNKSILMASRSKRHTSNARNVAAISVATNVVDLDVIVRFKVSQMKKWPQTTTNLVWKIVASWMWMKWMTKCSAQRMFHMLRTVPLVLRQF